MGQLTADGGWRPGRSNGQVSRRWARLCACQVPETVRCLRGGSADPGWCLVSLGQAGPEQDPVIGAPTPGKSDCRLGSGAAQGGASGGFSGLQPGFVAVAGTGLSASRPTGARLPPENPGRTEARGDLEPCEDRWQARWPTVGLWTLSPMPPSLWPSQGGTHPAGERNLGPEPHKAGVAFTAPLLLAAHGNSLSSLLLPPSRGPAHPPLWP